MRILTTGKGSSGSWQVRGVQLGGAVGNVKKLATLEDCINSDAIVYVKRIDTATLQNIRKSGKPWIWDIVDAYPQSNGFCSTWNRSESIWWAREQVRTYKPDGIIWPTRHMQADCDLPGIVIPHHARNEPINPIRRQVQVVGYQGSQKYLGYWQHALEKECHKRGWALAINVPLNRMDIVVAFRAHAHNGYIQKHWKSNVKLANAHGTGTPFIGAMECGYMETKTGKEQWCDNPKDLSFCLDELKEYSVRKDISETFLANTITLESCAEQLKNYVKTLL